MEYFVSNDFLLREVVIPPSKSYAQRAILAATLGTKPVTLISVGESDDVQHFLSMSRQLGAAIADQSTKESNNYQIRGNAYPINRELNAGESGLGIRLAVPVAAVMHGDFTLKGEGSLLKRPMTEFASFLPQLGLDVRLTGDYLPISISGNAVPGELKVDGSLSSQYLSGLLMALPVLNGDSIIHVSNLKSTPYIDITLDVLKSFGVQVIQKNYAQFYIKGGQLFDGCESYTVEGDYSGASNWMVFGALNEGIAIKGLNPDSVQGDKTMLEALENAKVPFKWKDKTLYVEAAEIQPFSFDATHCPDLFPALVVLAAGAIGKSTVYGVKRLIHKESNRALVLQKEMQKLGLKIVLEGDEMHLFGTGKLTSGTIDSNNDHRIAMAGAIAACLTDKGVHILQAESVNKSYPNFWDHFENTL